jgi:hypothetical protein
MIKARILQSCAPDPTADIPQSRAKRIGLHGEW